MKIESTIPSKQFFVILKEEMQMNSLSIAIKNSFKRFNKLKEKEHRIKEGVFLVENFKVKL